MSKKAAAADKSRLNIFVPITKVDAVKGIVYGTLAAEELDRSGEIFDYAGSKPYFEKWSDGISKATGGKSLGNLRAMHGSVAAGKLTDIAFDDDAKRIGIAAKVVDKNELEKVLEGVYTGFSIGGKYISRKKDGDSFRYVADPYEGSLVDLPCMPSATFEIVKADGATLQKKFNPVGEVEAEARKLAKAAGIADIDLDAQWPSFEDDAIEVLTKVAVAGAGKDPVADAAAAVPKEPTNEQVVAKATELAKAAGKESAWLDHIEPARVALKAAPAVAKVAVVAGTNVAAAATALALAHGATRSDDGTEAQVWIHPRLKGQQFASKALMRQGLIDLDAAEAAGGAAKDITNQLGDLSKSLQDRESGFIATKVYEALSAATAAADEVLRKAAGIELDAWKLAGQFTLAQPEHEAVKALRAVEISVDKTGALKDMPAATKAALVAVADAAADALAKSAVVSDADRQRLAADGSAMPDGALPIVTKADLKTALRALPDIKSQTLARRHIVKRARALQALDALPKDWGLVAESVDLAKIAKADLAKAASLYGVGSLISLLAQVDSAEESLESPSYGYGTMVPKALCDRFGTVLVELGDIVAEVLDLVLAEIRTEEGNEAAGAVMRMAKAASGFAIVLAEQPLAKVGARHSKADTNMIQGIHDAAVGLGGACDDETEKLTDVVDLRKQLVAKDAAFTKTMGDIGVVLKDVAERIKRIEAQPLPEGTTSYRVIEKGREVPLIEGPNAGAPGIGNARTYAEMAADMAGMEIRASHHGANRERPGFMNRRDY